MLTSDFDDRQQTIRFLFRSDIINLYFIYTYDAIY